MKLIPRRKQEPTTFERVTGYVKLGAKGLAAQRVARKGVRRYKFTKKAVTLGGLGAVTLVVLKKVKGGGSDAPSAPAYTPPPAASTGPSAGTSAAAAATAATGTPPINGNGASSDAPADVVAEGSGPDTPPEAAAPGIGDESGTAEAAPSASEKTVEFLPPVDASGTDETLDIEAPNQSTPPPPKGK